MIMDTTIPRRTGLRLARSTGLEVPCASRAQAEYIHRRLSDLCYKVRLDPDNLTIIAPELSRAQFNDIFAI